MAVTRTYAILDVSPAAYEEIKKRLQVVGADERVQERRDSDNNPCEILILGDIALKRETDDKVKVFLLYEGKKL